MDLLRAISCRQLAYGGRLYSVRAPSVREALAVLYAARVVSTEDATAEAVRTAWKVVSEHVAGWLDEDLLAALEERPVVEAIRVLLRLIYDEGEDEAPRARAALEAGRRGAPGDSDQLLEHPERLLADYMHAYAMPLAVALEEPWEALVLLAKEVDRLHAAASVRYLHARGLPYIKDSMERERAFDALRDRAGLSSPERAPIKAKTPEEMKAEQLRRLDQVFAEMATAGATGEALQAKRDASKRVARETKQASSTTPEAPKA